MENGETCYFEHVSTYENAGFAVLRDIHGEPVLVLQVNVARRAAKILGAVWTLGILLVLLVGALAGSVAIFWLDKASWCG